MNRNNQKRSDGASVATSDYLPSDSSLEAAVLGALLLENQYLADVRGVITSTAFYDTVNAKIFGILCRLDDKGATPDLYTVSQQAKAEGIAPVYVAELTQTVGSGVEVLNHARQLAGLEMQRRLIFFSAELAAKAQAGPDAAEWAAFLFSRLCRFPFITLNLQTTGRPGRFRPDPGREDPFGAVSWISL